MKTMLPIALALLTTAPAALAQGNVKQTMALKGLWYMKGESTRPCSIVVRNAGPLTGSHLLMFVNERGDRSFGVLLTPTTFEASNWPGADGTVTLKAEVVTDPKTGVQKIKWSGEGFWSRVPDLNGKWLLNGNTKQTCTVTQRTLDPNAQFVNEKGERGAATIMGDTVTVEKWGAKKNMTVKGKIKGNRIEWDTGVVWVREK